MADYAYTATFSFLHFEKEEDIVLLDPWNSPDPFGGFKLPGSRSITSDIIWRKELDL